MNHTECVDLLSAVADRPYESCEVEWKKLLQALRLGLSYVLPIQAVLRQQRWKLQPNPAAYVRKAAVRVAVRMGLVDIRPKENLEILASDLNYTDWDGEHLGHDDKLGMALYEFEEKYRNRDDGLDNSAADYLPAEVLLEGTDEVDWDRVAELAGLDAGERLVLDLRVIGFRREDAFAACLTEADRRLLQAAWKRFARHKEALRKALQSGRKHSARRISGVVPGLELMFIETPDNGLKIFFQKLVPENGKPRI